MKSMESKVTFGQPETTTVEIGFQTKELVEVAKALIALGEQIKRLCEGQVSLDD